MLFQLTVAYPAAKTIHLAMDNLSTHSKKSLTDFYGDEVGTDIWDRFTVQYTPKHESWLNQAEIEISLLTRRLASRSFWISTPPTLRCTDTKRAGSNHGHYGHHCYLPLYIFCGDHVLRARLRPSSIGPAMGAKKEVARVVQQIRRRWRRCGSSCGATPDFVWTN